MKPTIEVLFGFDERTVQEGIVRYLDDCGFAVHDAVKLNKIGIEDYLNLNPSCQTVVLKEVIGKGQKYSAEELARLTDNHDVNVVVVLNSNHYGTEYMERLYIAGITSAILHSGRKGGASVKDIGNLIIQKRSRQDARVYYGISEEKIDIGYLTDKAYVEYYRALSNPEYGDTLLERFLQVCTYMEAPKIADFIRRLPEDTMSQLGVYQEFYDVIDLLRRMGFDLGIKRPKKVKVGLSTPAALLDAKELIESGRSGMKDQYNIVKPVQEKKTPSVEESEVSRDYHDDFDDRLNRGEERSHKTPQKEERAEVYDTDDLASLFGFDDSDGGKNDYDEYEPDPEYKPDPSFSFDDYDDDEYIPKNEYRAGYRGDTERHRDDSSHTNSRGERSRSHQEDDEESRRYEREERDRGRDGNYDRYNSRDNYRDDYDEEDQRRRDSRARDCEGEYVPPEPEKKEEPRKRKLFGKKKEESDVGAQKERKEREKRSAREKRQLGDDDFDEKPQKKSGLGMRFVIISILAWAGICAFLAFDFLFLLK